MWGSAVSWIIVNTSKSSSYDLQSNMDFMNRTNLTSVRRLAAAVLKCGKRKIWMDPNEVTTIAAENSRMYQTVHSLWSTQHQVQILTTNSFFHNRHSTRTGMISRQYTGTGLQKN
jgi:large subunit ribosomal protein L19e